MITTGELDRAILMGPAWGVDPQPEDVVSLDEDLASVVDGRRCIKSGCDAHTQTFRGLIQHLKRAHSERPPDLSRVVPAIEIFDRNGAPVSWEEIDSILTHPHFWRVPEGVVYSDASID